MNTEQLSNREKSTLLELARQSIECAVHHKPLPRINLEEFSPKLRENGASFVTLTIHGDLRGCIGALEAYQPLVQDVCEHAAAAAMEDYRFPPLTAIEFTFIEIEISRLTQPQPLIYQQPLDLLDRLQPGVDGVILRDGLRRSTFLPQVWEKLPNTGDFLTHLCQKMGVPGNHWQRKMLQVFTYKVEEFRESPSEKAE